MKIIRLQSRRVMLALSILLLNAAGMTKAYASYDFEAVCPSGQTLYYNIIDATNHYVALTYPNDLDNPWWCFPRPYGNITLPGTVQNNGIDYTVTEIGDYAFCGCDGMTGSLIIPSFVTRIGKCAFKNCYGFTGHLTIPNSVTTIDESAFWQCGGFTGDLTIPNSVTSIADSTFALCGGFTGRLVIPNTVTSIGNEAFNFCRGFTSLSIGNSVTSIGNGAFESCWQLSGDLVIPNSVVTIGEYAFSGCQGFTGNLNIGNSVTTIGDWAFESCNGFTGDLTIPNSVISIGGGAFEGCYGFTGLLTIPNTVTTIGERAFESCSGFTGNLTIPNSVTSIGSGAFGWCSGFTSLAIGNSVTSIGDGAFGGCSGLTFIFIPSSVTTLGENAFWYCDGIEQITVASGNPVYDSRNSCNAIIETASNILITGCKNTIVPNTVSTIGVYAFYGCGVTSVVLPASVTTLLDFAYGNCYNLTIVNIPNHVVSIGNGVFASSYGIEQITVDEGNPVYDSRGNCNAIIETSSNTLIQGCKNTVIPNSVMKIGNYSFRGCLGLTSIEMPDSVLEIGDLAFCGSGLSGKLKIGNFVTKIGDSSFYGCCGLTSIEIGNSVTRIGKQAFMDCYNLSGDLVIPNSVIVIDDRAFFYEDSFDGTLILGNSLDSIGYRAFGGCYFNTVISLNELPPTLGYGELEIYPYPNLIVCCGSKEVYEASDWVNCVSTIEEDCSPHNVIVDEGNMNGGTVSASVSLASFGEEVQLTVMPNEGMMLSLLTVCNANDPSQTVSIYPIGKANSTYGFFMPQYDVVVKAVFIVGNAVGESSNINISVYPNPTIGMVSIEAEGIRHITISNSFGQVIYQGKVEGNEFTYDFGSHEAGVYLARIETTKGVVVKKVSVTR